MRINGTKGVAMIVALALLTVVAGIMTLFFTRSVNEVRHSADDVGIVRALMLARGAANLGSGILQAPIRAQLNTLVRARPANGCWTFGDDSDCDIPEPNSVVQDFAGIRTSLQGTINNLVCSDVSAGEGQTMRVSIFVSNIGCPLEDGGTQTLPAGIELPDPRFVVGSPRNRGSRTQTYALPYVMISEGRVGDYTRRVVQQGEFQFTVGQTSFSRYGLFTNVHRGSANPNGDKIWFTQNTLFDGPVHTNQTFNFYRNPWFGGEVTSAGCTTPLATSCENNGYRKGADFFASGFQAADNLSNNPSFRNQYGTHAPEMPAGVTWDADFVPLPENNNDQKLIAEGVDEDGNEVDGGIPLHTIFDNVDSLELVATDENMNPLTKDRHGNWVPEATYQHVRACNEYTGIRKDGNTFTRYYCFELRFDENHQIEIREPLNMYGISSNWASPGEYKLGGSKRTRLQTYNNGEFILGNLYDDLADFNSECNECVLYVDGKIDRLKGPARTPADSDNPDEAPPALASFSQMTIAADSQVRITGDLKYEDAPCTGSARRSGSTVVGAQCNDLDAENVLGVYVQGDNNGNDDNILIGNHHNDNSLRAPKNVTVHGILMTSTGAVTVERYNQGSARGTMNLLGGVIENFYGPFGTFDSSTGEMGTGYSRNFTYDQRMRSISPPAFPGVAQDSVLGVIPLSFGQREQLF